MFDKKIFVFLMIAALSILLLSSASFSTELVDVSGSFVVRSNIEKTGAGIPVVKTVANIKVGALTDSISVDIGENLDRASKDIHNANVKKAEEERARQEAKKQQESKAASSNTHISNTSVNSSGSEAEILNLINQTRANHGLSTLSPNQMLTDLARLRSSDMVSRGYFSHHTPDGQNIKHIFAQYGVTYKNFGENLGNAKPASYGSPGAFLNAWMNSPSHRDNMLKDYYTHIGVGVVDGGGRRVVTVLFIR